MKFSDLKDLPNEPLLEVLKLIPNEVLLSALHDSDAEPVLKRICESLSKSSAEFLKDDLKSFIQKNQMNPARLKNQIWIADVARHVLFPPRASGLN